MTEPVVIERREVSVMFKRVADDPDLRGRRYYGAFDADGEEYRVCVELRQGDDPEALGLEAGTLPAVATCGCGSPASRPRFIA